jgi:AcrR family transcriptional regulator
MNAGEGAMMARPRVFDLDEAVVTATDLFWRKGYGRTSLSDLTGALGIKPPSFYFAFGSKEDLFRKVLEKYRETRLTYAEEALDRATAREVAEQMLMRLAELYTDPARPPGCLSVNCSMPGGSPAGPVAEELKNLRRARRQRIRERFERAQREGDLAADADADELARYVITIGWGMAVDAQSGASRKELLATVGRAMLAWPS